MSRCYVNWRNWDSGRGEHCDQPAVPDRMYCEIHLRQAMARVAMVRNDAPRPWSGAVRGSAVGPARRWRTVQG